MSKKSVWSSAATALLIGIETFAVTFTAAWVGLTGALHIQSWKTPAVIIATALSLWSAAGMFQMSENAARAELELQRIALETSTAAKNSSNRKNAPKDKDQES